VKEKNKRTKGEGTESYNFYVPHFLINIWHKLKEN